MKLTTLEDVVCPNMVREQACTGDLRIADVFNVRSASNNEELLEGILTCTECGAEYPVLCGVLVLLRDVASFFRERFWSITSTAALHGASRQILGYLEQKGYHLSTRSYRQPDYDSPRWLEMFLCLHYDSLVSLLPQEHPVLSLCQSVDKDFWETVTDEVRSGIIEGRFALDVGCNVGGMLYRLSPRFARVYGIDISFSGVLTARSVLLGQPETRRHYALYREGNLFEERVLNVETTDNVDVIVASGLEVPFKRHFDLVSTLNVLDVVPDPPGLLKSISRTLVNQGFLVLSSPYTWIADDAPVERWLGGTNGISSPDALRNELKRLGMSIVHEIDGIPWIWREYDRWFRVYLVHCVLACKGSPSTAG